MKITSASRRLVIPGGKRQSTGNLWLVVIVYKSDSGLSQCLVKKSVSPVHRLALVDSVGRNTETS